MDSNSIGSKSDMPARRTGRPRLDKTKDSAIQHRRDQIRSAQRTYRLKKEATLQSLRARCTELDNRTKRMEEMFSNIYDAATRFDIARSYPEFGHLINDAASHFGKEKDAPEEERERHEGAFNRLELPGGRAPEPSGMAPCSKPNGIPQSQTIFGFVVSSSNDTTEFPNDSFPQVTSAIDVVRTDETLRPTVAEHAEGLVSYADTQTPLMTVQTEINTAAHTYSFHESSFSRRLQRNCLEHCYQLFDNPASDPQQIYRVFRLVACIQDRGKMKPYFQRLLQRGAGEPIEVPNQPFYCIGGAGKHYPRRDIAGNPVYPSNLRLPKRILGIMRSMLSNDPFGCSSYDDILCSMGYGGEWFDCNDVEGFLRENGIVVNPQSSVVTFYRRDRGQTSGIQALMDETHFLRDKAYRFDVDQFVEELCQRTIILGRVPGFQKSTVCKAIINAVY